MPAERTSTAASLPGPSRLVHLAVLILAMGTAACGSVTSNGPAAGTTPTPSRPLAPWQGTFVAVAPPAGVQTLADVACPTASRCWAVGSTLATGKSPSSGTVVATADGGTTWRVQSVPTTVGYLAGIACSGVRTCTAVGQVGTGGAGPGAVLTTADGGVTWRLQSVPAGTTDVTAITCSTGGRCTALAGISGRVTSLTAIGTSGVWTAGGALPDTVSTGTSVSCTDAGHCWATGTSPIDVGHMAGVVAATADGGATWALQTVPSPIGALQGISCSSRERVPGPTTTRPSGTGSVSCTAVGTTGTAIVGVRAGRGVVLTTVDGGSIWVSAAVPPTSAGLLAVSCGAGPCVAVGTTVGSAPQSGIVVLNGIAESGANGWRRVTVATIALPLTGVSCRSLTACVVVGESVTAHLTSG